MSAELLERIDAERESRAALDRHDDAERLKFLNRGLVASEVLIGQRFRDISLHRLTVRAALDVADLGIATTPARELALLDLTENEQVGEALSRLRHRSTWPAR